jgi:TPR repeat protein
MNKNSSIQCYLRWLWLPEADVFRFDHIGSRILATLGSSAAQLAHAGRLSGRGAHQAAFYLLGLGVPPSLSAALHWLVRAAEADEVEAQTLLASLALQGVCDTKSTSVFETTLTTGDQHPNYRVALHWAEQAVAHGSAAAQAILGNILTGGPAELRDCERGEQYYRHSAEAGCAQGRLGWALILLRRNTLGAAREACELLQKAAMANIPAARFILGVIAESGAAGPQDFAAAAEHYRVAAGLGHRSAQLRYGIALLSGRGVEADPFNGESWLRRAGLAGEPQAAAMIGDLYACQGELPPNYVEAAMWLRRAAEAGHTGAAKTLGHLLLGVAGLNPDPEEAALWLRLAIAGGEFEARNDLARLALMGQVPEADQQATCSWFQEQAETGDLAAAFDLGLCFAQGIGAPRDDNQALALFERAAVTMPVAQYWCGRMRAEGRGCPPDLRAARAWFLRAAELQNPDAEVAAGEMLINGRGGPPDQEFAMALFRRAASVDHPGALFALEVMGRVAGNQPIEAANGQIAPARMVFPDSRPSAPTYPFETPDAKQSPDIDQDVDLITKRAQGRFVMAGLA